MSFLQLKNLSKQYTQGPRRRSLFKDLNLDIEEGEVVALLGASGSGKTSVLNLISGIDYADEGEIWIGGRSVHQLMEPQRTTFRRNNIGFVFQFFNLIPTLTVIENLTLPMELIDYEPQAARFRAHELLQRVGLERRADSFPERLSGGEQQRAAVARALAHRPELILADEPTGNLDAETGKIIMDLLLEMSREHKSTVFIVTHSQTVANATDRALSLQNGVLVPA